VSSADFTSSKRDCEDKRRLIVGQDIFEKVRLSAVLNASLGLPLVEKNWEGEDKMGCQTRTPFVLAAMYPGGECGFQIKQNLSTQRRETVQRRLFKFNLKYSKTV
jgi:hypothetical protein